MVKVDFPYTFEPKKGFIYFRRKGFPRVRIHYIDADGNEVYPTDKRSAEWPRAYWHTRSSVEGSAPTPKAANDGSIGFLISSFKGSTAFAGYSDRWKKEVTRHLASVEDLWGDIPAPDISTANIYNMQQKMASRPRAADQRVGILRALFKHARLIGLRQDNPSTDIPKINVYQPYEPWPSPVMDYFFQHAAPRVVDVCMLARFTGQRLGDCLAMTPSHRKDGKLDVVQEKTGKRLLIPEHPILGAYMKSRAVIGLQTIAVNSRGESWTTDGFKTVFRNEVIRVRTTGYVFHGFRKNAVNALLIAGCTTKQVSSITGMSLQMVELYSKQIDQERLAIDAMNLWVASEQS